MSECRCCNNYGYVVARDPDYSALLHPTPCACGAAASADQRRVISYLDASLKTLDKVPEATLSTRQRLALAACRAKLTTLMRQLQAREIKAKPKQKG